MLPDHDTPCHHDIKLHARLSFQLGSGGYGPARSGKTGNRQSDGLTIPVINDYAGNVLATISGISVNWNPVRVSGYGPVLGYQASTLTAGTPLADTLVWRSRGMDPSGFYNLGARYYDPIAGHFLSPDPLGHAGSMDLYSFCSGDPINRFDPTGRFATGNTVQGLFELGEGIQDIHTAFTDAREDAREFDVAHEDAIDNTLIEVDSAAVVFAVPIVAEGLLGEGLGVEAGVGLEEGELGGIEGFNARSASWASSLEESEGTEMAEAGAVETKAGDSALSTVAKQEVTAGANIATPAVEATAASTSETASIATSAVGEATPEVAATTSETASIASQTSQSVAGSGEAAEESQTLFHYTNEKGLTGILDSGELNPSLKALNPNDVRYGNGQYLSDIVPGTKTPAQLSRSFLGQPFQGASFSHYLEVDVSGLNVIQGRPGVFVIPGETPLDLSGRIISSGAVPKP